MFPGMGGMGGGLALNQLLVQMDGVDEPPFMRKFFTNRINTFLDATYIVPQRIRKLRLRIKPPKPRPEQVYFIGATNVPLEALDPALIRPGRMGRHIWFRTPTKDDRKDIFDLYLDRVSHDEDLDSDERRDELARMTNGYSPAMIEQVCSMALTYAHSEAREEFDRKDIVEAMTTIESGTAVGVNYIEEESRAVAIHEAGHAVASHVYMNDVLSTRLSIRMRGGSLGHHQAIQKEERFSSWRHQEVGNLVWTLGAMAAEHVFYGENSNGVGGDIQSATWIASRMVGMSGMGPEPLDLRGRVAKERLPEVEKELMERFERIGLRIMNRARMGGAMDSDPIGSVLGDPAKRSAAAQILGQAYLTAVCCIRANREAVAARGRRARPAQGALRRRGGRAAGGRRAARPGHRRPRREHLAQGMSEPDDKSELASAPGTRRARSPSTIRLAAARVQRAAPAARRRGRRVRRDRRGARRRPAARAPPRRRRARRGRRAPPPTRRASSS